MVISLMVSPSRNSLVGSTPKPNRKGLASHIGNDPKDERIPIGPGDVITSVDRAAVHGAVLLNLARRVLDLFVQPHEHSSQEGLVHIHAVRDALADFQGFFQQIFGFRHFHDCTVGRLAGGEYVQRVIA